MNHISRLPQLSAAKPRSGLRSFAELVECLVRVYEKQNDVEQRLHIHSVNTKTKPNETRKHRSKPAPVQVVPLGSEAASPVLMVSLTPEKQTTFGFYNAVVP